MKKILFLLLLLLCGVQANAQFDPRLTFVRGSLSGLRLTYRSPENFGLGLDADAGYFITDCVMLRANLGYEHTRQVDDVRVGVGARYYFLQNGIYLGAGAEYNHFTPSNNDVMIPVEVGYAFFLNRHVTVEPALYYKMSLHDFSGNSTVGLRIGFGYYF